MPNLDTTQPIYTNTMRPNLDRRLLGNELRVPEFNGNPMEFDSFWKLFEELVHKQPYTNIEKLSILLSCCKGDASRTLKMIPRTGESYESAMSSRSHSEDSNESFDLNLDMIDLVFRVDRVYDTLRRMQQDINHIKETIDSIKDDIKAANEPHPNG
ncbi:hypothetical protein ANCCAN_01207 [Ancylostoma caninum]|uniref:Uncharacterized protein n=1 Tax=Ancylostoma caninum TaxID=29170 RepID=A0A368HA58_ANCCA|nr:hypothetical protein ANCCAN_01207 [Ancylostoma caninum]